MLRLGLAVCLPSPLQYYPVSLRSNLQKPITSGLDPHVTRVQSKMLSYRLLVLSTGTLAAHSSEAATGGGRQRGL